MMMPDVLAKPQLAPRHQAHVAPFKKVQVKRLCDLFTTYPIIGLLNMESLPSAQANMIRQKLRSSVVITMAKKRLIRRALDDAKKSKPGIEQIEQFLTGMPGLLFTRENPFSIFKTIKKSKSPAAAKPGQKAPRDIMIKAGPTPFPPGPVISELAGLGIKSKVEGGKVAVISDTVVVTEGGVISDKLASMLLRLSITPMEVGLDLVALYENGMMLKKDVLDIDEEVFIAKLTQAASWACNLSVETAFPTMETRELLVQKAWRQAKALALEAAIMGDEVKGELLAKGEAQALALKKEAKL